MTYREIWNSGETFDIDNEDAEINRPAFNRADYTSDSIEQLKRQEKEQQEVVRQRQSDLDAAEFKLSAIQNQIDEEYEEIRIDVEKNS